MTDKQQIIEEIVDAMTVYCGECYSCQFNGNRNNKVSCTDYLVAEALYNKNYRRVPENAILLTKEQYQLLRQNIYGSTKADINYILAQLGVEVPND